MVLLRFAHDPSQNATFPRENAFKVRDLAAVSLERLAHVVQAARITALIMGVFGCEKGYSERIVCLIHRNALNLPTNHALSVFVNAFWWWLDCLSGILRLKCRERSDPRHPSSSVLQRPPDWTAQGASSAVGRD